MLDFVSENNRRVGNSSLCGIILDDFEHCIDMIKRLLKSKCELENINKVILVEKNLRIQIYNCQDIIRIDIKRCR